MINISGKVPFLRRSDPKKEKSVHSFTHEQNDIICSQTQLDDIAHEKTIICKQLSAGHVVGSWLMKRKKHLHPVIRAYISRYISNNFFVETVNIII